MPASASNGDARALRTISAFLGRGRPESDSLQSFVPETKRLKQHQDLRNYRTRVIQSLIGDAKKNSTQTKELLGKEKSMDVLGKVMSGGDLSFHWKGTAIRAYIGSWL